MKMTVSDAIQILMALIALSGRVVGMIKKVSGIIRSAQAEGRDLTEAEIKQVQSIDDSARASLVQEIAKAKTK